MTRFARNTAFSTIAGVSYSLGAFFTSIIVARILGVEAAGAVALAVWLVTVTVTLTDLGIFATLTRFLPELTYEGSLGEAHALTWHLFRVFAIAAFLPILIFALLAFLPALSYASHYVFGSGTNSAIWIAIGCLCVAQSLSTFMQAFWRGMQRFDTCAYVVMASALFQLAAVIIGGISFGIVGIIGGLVCGWIIPAVCCVWLPIRQPPISPALKRRVARHAVYSWAAAIASTFVWSRLELVLLNHYYDSHAVGLFSVGLALSTMATQGPMLLTGGLLAHLSAQYGGKNFDSIRDATATGTRILAFLVLPLCFGLAALLPTLLPLIYGNAFVAAVPSATILVASAAIGATGAVASNVVFASERSDFVALTGVFGGLISVIVGMIIIPHFGIMGAAWGRAGVQALLVGIGFWFVHRRLGYPMPIGHLARLAFSALLCAVAARTTLLLIPGAAGLGAAIATGAVTYFAAVYVFRALPRQDVERALSMVPFLPAHFHHAARYALQRF